jgi:FAD/FMN-containing dehydrogenase
MSGGDMRQENRILGAFHGLVLDGGHTFTNWGISRSTKPAVYLEPINYADVQAAVRDEKGFPSPIHPVGSISSVTSTIVNDGGTLLCTRKLDEVVGLEYDPLVSCPVNKWQ